MNSRPMKSKKKIHRVIITTIILSGTKRTATGWLSSPYSKVRTAWLRGVLSSSIQFPRDIIHILLISFSRSVLYVRHLVFSTSLHDRRASHLGHQLKRKKNTVRNLQYSPQTRLVRDIYVPAKAVLSAPYPKIFFLLYTTVHYTLFMIFISPKVEILYSSKLRTK